VGEISAATPARAARVALRAARDAVDAGDRPTTCACLVAEWKEVRPH